MTWTFPNVLTALRLLAAPLIAVMFLTFPRPFADFAAMGLFIVASLTDIWMATWRGAGNRSQNLALCWTRSPIRRWL